MTEAGQSELCNLLKAGLYIFSASPADAISIKAAKDFISEHKFTSEDVKLVTSLEYIAVVTKRQVDLNKKDVIP